MTTWYVDAIAGSDSGDGSTDNRWRLIMQAVNSGQLSPGDTVSIAPGTYRETVVIPEQLSGEPGYPITFESEGGRDAGFQVVTGAEIVPGPWAEIEDAGGDDETRVYQTPWIYDFDFHPCYNGWSMADHRCSLLDQFHNATLDKYPVENWILRDFSERMVAVFGPEDTAPTLDDEDDKVPCWTNDGRQCSPDLDDIWREVFRKEDLEPHSFFVNFNLPPGGTPQLNCPGYDPSDLQLDPIAGTLCIKLGADDLIDQKHIEAAVRAPLLIVEGSHIHIKRLTFRFAANPPNCAAVQLNGESIRFEHNIVEWNSGAGLLVGGAHSRLCGNWILNNGQEGITAGPGADHAILSKNMTNLNSLRWWNISAPDWKVPLDSRHSFGQGGLVIKNNATDWLIHDHISKQNLLHGIWFDKVGDRTDFPQKKHVYRIFGGDFSENLGAGVRLEGVNTAEVAGARIYKNRSGMIVDSANCFIHNNVIFENETDGMLIKDPPPASTGEEYLWLYNNTFVNHVNGLRVSTPGLTTMIRNNILARSWVHGSEDAGIGLDVSPGSSVVIENNDFWKNGTDLDPDANALQPDDSNLFLDPLFCDEGAWDFRLQPCSLLQDKATQSGLANIPAELSSAPAIPTACSDSACWLELLSASFVYPAQDIGAEPTVSQNCNNGLACKLCCTSCMMRSHTMNFETDYLNIETGEIIESHFHRPKGVEWTLKIAYNADRPAHAVIFQNQSEGVEIAHLPDRSFGSVTHADTSVPFTEDLIDESFDRNRVVLIRHKQVVYKLGCSAEYVQMSNNTHVGGGVQFLCMPLSP